MTNDELKALVESNARAIEANAVRSADTDRKINNLADIVQAFIAKLDSEGLRVTLITDVADDTAGEVLELERDTKRHNVSIEALRADAIADRQAFKAQADADREAFRKEMAEARTKADADREAFRKEMAEARAKADEDRQRSDERFAAMQENIQRLFLEVRSTNVAVAGLSNQIDELEAG